MEILAVAGPREGLAWIDAVAVIVYLIVTSAIVIWSSRQQEDTEDYFLGGRSMPWMAVGLSLLATLMSSISYMGMPGEIIAKGVTMFTQYLALPFSMFVVLFIWVPFFMRLKMTSAYEYLERRFDRRARILGGLLFLLLRLGWMSMVMYVGSLALRQMTFSLVPEGTLDPLGEGFTSALGTTPLLRETLLYWIVAVVGVSATFYACAGGFRAAVWNDVLQSVMLLGGTLVVLTYVTWTTGTGPFDWWQIATEHTESHTKLKLFSLDPTVRTTVFTAVCMSFFWTICTHGSDQVVLQRYFSTRSLASARRSYLVNAMTDVTVGALLALSGLALLSFYLQHPTFLPTEIMSEEGGKVIVHRGDRVLPHFFAHQLPAGFGGIALAALLCDAMQTLVSGVNSISAVFTPETPANADERSKGKLSSLTLARLMTFAVGLLVTGLGIAVSYMAQRSGRNILEMMAPAFNMFLGPLASLFLIGMFLKCTARSLIPAVLCSLAISFVWSYWKELFGTEKQPTFTLTTAIPYLSSYLIAAFLSLFGDRNSNHPGLAYTWKAVMSRPDENEDPPTTV